jgi:hypothetical protein
MFFDVLINTLEALATIRSETPAPDHHLLVPAAGNPYKGSRTSARSRSLFAS